LHSGCNADIITDKPTIAKIPEAEQSGTNNRMEAVVEVEQSREYDVPVSDCLSETQASNNVSDNDVELLTKRLKSQVTNSDCE